MEIGIIGAGGWGTALASHLARQGHTPIIWCYESSTCKEINAIHTNNAFLQGVTLPTEITATDNIADLHDCSLLINATPTQHIRPLIRRNRELFVDKRIINVAKGIETGTMYRISQIFKEIGNIDMSNYAVLTGPSHAEEVARRVPTAVVAASSNPSYVQSIQELFSSSEFRVYTSPDVIGCELGGALKNVIALVAGILDGAGYGDNTKAALVTRGLSEMMTLGVAMGASFQTFFGLSGIGDLFVTCTSRFSRNRAVGERLGKGERLKDILKGMKMVAEGIETTKSAYELSKKHNIEMPIVTKVYQVIFRGYDLKEAIEDLMTRESKREWI